MATAKGKIVAERLTYTPENETTPERYFWDNVIRCIEALSEVDETITWDIVESLKDEDREDALTLLYNYTIMVTVADGESSNLEQVEAFLAANGLTELP